VSDQVLVSAIGAAGLFATAWIQFRRVAQVRHHVGRTNGSGTLAEMAEGTLEGVNRLEAQQALFERYVRRIEERTALELDGQHGLLVDLTNRLDDHCRLDHSHTPARRAHDHPGPPVPR
jgi:hypothetical protein